MGVHLHALLGQLPFVQVALLVALALGAVALLAQLRDLLVLVADRLLQAAQRAVGHRVHVQSVQPTARRVQLVLALREQLLHVVHLRPAANYDQLISSSGRKFPAFRSQ